MAPLLSAFSASRRTPAPATSCWLMCKFWREQVMRRAPRWSVSNTAAPSSSLRLYLDRAQALARGNGEHRAADAGFVAHGLHPEHLEVVDQRHPSQHQDGLVPIPAYNSAHSES